MILLLMAAVLGGMCDRLPMAGQVDTACVRLLDGSGDGEGGADGDGEGNSCGVSSGDGTGPSVERLVPLATSAGSSGLVGAEDAAWACCSACRVWLMTSPDALSSVVSAGMISFSVLSSSVASGLSTSVLP